MDMHHAEIADTISRSAFVSLVSQLTGANPNPDDAEPHGPGAPVIRRVLDRFRHLVGPGPEPWSVFGPQPEPWLAVALNPQPLPPRLALATALAQEMIDRTMLLHDLADALPGDTQAHVQQAVGRRLSEFADEYCGNEPRWPFPGPSRGDGAPESMRAIEQVVMGVQFKRAAETLPYGALQQGFAEAGDRFIEAGVAGV